MKPGSLLTVMLAVLVAGSFPAEAQFLKKLKNKAERKAEQLADKQVDKGLDAAANAVECAIDDRECIEKAESAGQPVVIKDQQGNVVSTPDDVKPGEGVWANYDFVPGNHVLFAEDFEDDRVGNFPRRLEFVSGNAEVVEWHGQRLLRASSRTVLRVPLSETLPERFTIEFDYHQPAGHLALYLAPSARETSHWNQYAGSYFMIGNKSGVIGEGPESATAIYTTRERVTPVRIQVDGSYAKMYLDERRVANLPNANVVRGKALEIDLNAREDKPSYLGDLRVAAGGLEMYDTLKAEGRVATRGILFDVNSSRIRPESTPTLDEIARMLERHEALRIAIEGHTDSTGDDASNLALSQRRAEAVRDQLVTAHGIDASRLEAKGFGETKPAGDNATPEGRQNNRRVELVLLEG